MTNDLTIYTTKYDQGGYVLDDAKKLKLEHVLWVSSVLLVSFTIF